MNQQTITLNVMRTKQIYSIESIFDGVLAQYDYVNEITTVQEIRTICEREYNDIPSFIYNSNGFSFEIRDRVGEIDEVTVYFQTVELSFEQELSEVLIENRIQHTVASTGTVYVKKEIDGFEGIRIADHNPNGSNSYLEINAGSIKNIEAFVSRLADAIDNDSIELIQEFVY